MNKAETPVLNIDGSTALGIGVCSAGYLRFAGDDVPNQLLRQLERRRMKYQLPVETEESMHALAPTASR